MRNALIVRFDAFHPGEPLLEVDALERAGVLRTRLHFTHLPGRTYLPHAETLWAYFYLARGAEWRGPLEPALVARMERHLPEFLHGQSRHYQDETSSDLAGFTRGVADDTHLFYRLVRFLHAKILEHRIDVMLFDEMPHYSCELVLYWLARELGIPALVFQQSIWNDRCWCVPGPEALGDVMALEDLSEPGAQAASAFETKLFYVVKRPTDRHEEWIARWKRKIRLLDVARLLLYRLGGKKKRFESNLSRIAGFKVRQLEGELGFRAYRKTVNRNPDLEKPFVLFCLHLQPEVTTIPLGGKYHDQLLAVEDLSTIIPPGVAIYVKEHPETFGAVRGEEFYARLASIPGVTLVDKDLPTPLLVDKSIFVATITGTVGFEAVKAGKSAVTFGYAWYNPLPGVFPWRDRPTYQQIVGHVKDDVALRAAFERVLCKSCGVSPRWALPQRLVPPDLDVERNNAELVRVVKKRLGVRETAPV